MQLLLRPVRISSLLYRGRVSFFSFKKEVYSMPSFVGLILTCNLSGYRSLNPSWMNKMHAIINPCLVVSIVSHITC